jgi:translocation and assembly module TamB
MKRLQWGRALWIAMALMAGAAALLLWLGGREATLTWIAGRLSAASGGALAIEGAKGSLYGPMTFDRIVYRGDDFQVSAEQITLRWRPLALARLKLQMEALSIRMVKVAAVARQAPPSLPASLTLPLAVALERLALERIEIQRGAETLVVTSVSASIASDGKRHRWRLMEAFTPWARVSGEGRLEGAAPFRLEASARLSEFRLPHFTAATVQASGDLRRLALTATPEAPWGQGTLKAAIAPFEERPLRRLAGELHGLDLSRLAPPWPTTLVELRFALEAAGEGLEGPVEAVNHAPGSLDRDRLPLSRLEGRLAVHDKGISARLPVIVLGQAGEASGEGQWNGERFELRLTTRGVRLNALHGRLRPLKPAGEVILAGTRAAQSLTARLREGPYALDLEARHEAGAVQVSRAILFHAGARLEAAGRLELQAPKRFVAHGTLRNFDPSVFVQAPPARVNATLEAHGRIDAPWSAAVRYRIAPGSAFRGSALVGEGELQVDGERLEIPRAFLAVGRNRLTAQGALGSGLDRLRLDLSAPVLTQLDPELAGSFSAHGWVGGSPKAPAFALEMSARALRVRGDLAVERLDMRMDASRGLAEPMAVRASVQGLAAQRWTLTQATLSLQGAQHGHTAEVQVQGPGIAGEARLQGALELDPEPAWSGRLVGFRTAEPYPLALTAPVSLELSRRHLALGAGRLELTGGGRVDFEPLLADGDQLRWAGRAEGLPVAALAPEPGKEAELEVSLVLGARWTIDASATLNGTVEVWREQGDVLLRGGRPLALGLERLTIAAHARDNVIEGRLSAAGARTGRVAGTFRTLAHREGGLWRLAPEAPLALEVQVDMPSLAWVERLLRTGVRLDGSVRGALTAEGTLREPGLRGSLRAENLAVRQEDLGLAFEQGEAEVDLDQDGLRLRRAAFRAGEGTLEARGSGRLVNGVPVLDLDVEARRTTLIQRPDQVLVASGSGKVKSKGGQISVTGKFQADRGLLELESFDTPGLSEDVVIVGAPVPEQGAPLGLAFDLEIDLGKAFRIRGEGLEARLAGRFRVVSDGTGPVQVKGTVRVAEGSYRAYGQQLTIERGVLLFDGPLANPTLNILAVRKSPTAEAGVLITGTALSPRSSLYSNPPVPDNQKLAWLILGPGTASAHTDFGFSTFRQEQQEITLGTQLTSAVYVSVGRSLEGTGNVARITMMLSEKWAVQAVTGTANGVNLVYTLSFD